MWPTEMKGMWKSQVQEDQVLSAPGSRAQDRCRLVRTLPLEWFIPSVFSFGHSTEDSDSWERVIFLAKMLRGACSPLGRERAVRQDCIEVATL